MPGLCYTQPMMVMNTCIYALLLNNLLRQLLVEVTKLSQIIISGALRSIRFRNSIDLSVNWDFDEE